MKLQRLLAMALAALIVGTGAYLRWHGRSEAYDAQFFAGMDRAARQSAETVVPELVRLIQPRSVVDVGSGDGYWSKAFLDNGVSDVIAVDGPWVRKEDLKVPADLFVVRDLEQPFHMDRPFDMVLCLETAEHLHPARAGGFIHDLTQLAPVVVFSAAIPGQGGTFHYNEEWPEYWADLFAKDSYEAIDVFRPFFWTNEKVAPMYRQNMILYVRKDYLEKSASLRQATAGAPRVVRALVHPEVYHNAVGNAAYAARWQTKVKRFLHLER